MAGKDLGEVGVDLGLGSKLELEVRDCEVSDRLGKPPCANNAPGVSDMCYLLHPFQESSSSLQLQHSGHFQIDSTSSLKIYKFIQ